ncbi:SENP7 [Symbiodinium natans]|uniref:SENP7 protein n=1 Tax=Symbiodinium natans TaxID=878477 RepID=A0A812I6J8_9DINO|nr:SENP7 [Symbiodinium natans]
MELQDMMQAFTESMQAAKTDSEARKARRRGQLKPPAADRVAQRSTREDAAKEGRKPRKRRLRLVASPDSRGDVALEEKSGLGSMGSSCASPSVSKCRAKPRASFDTVPVLAEKITSKKPKSESADRAASEESADHAASEASGGQSRRSLGSAERDVDIQKEEPTADDPDCPSRGRMGSSMPDEADQVHRPCAGNELQRHPEHPKSRQDESEKYAGQSLQDVCQVTDRREFSTAQSMLAGRMWQTFAQQLHYLSTLSVSVSSSLAHPLAWLAESLSSGGGDHSKPIASKLMAAAAFLELGVAIQLEGQRSVGDSASDFVKVSLLVRAMLDQVKQLDVSHGQDTVAQLEHVPSKQLLITISHLLDYARASGSTAIGTLLVDGVQRCCSLALPEEAVNRPDTPEQLSVASPVTCAAAVAAAAACRVCAEEALVEQANRLALMEARCRVRTACSQAACAAVASLRREIGQDTSGPRPASITEIFQAAEFEAEQQTKELQVLWEELEKGRGILASWSTVAGPVRRSECDGHAAMLSTSDWVRLEDGQHINDSLLDFFMNRLVQVLGGWRVHTFSSHFFAMLAGPHLEMEPGESDHGWTRVRTWTRGVRRRHPTGIFACDYLLLPLHHEAERHWSLAVVCRPWAAVDIYEDLQLMTTVAFLDSLRSPANEKHEVVALQKLKQYLRSEWMDCAGPLGSCFDEQRVQAVTINVPQQSNFSDCGIYVLCSGHVGGCVSF